MNGSNDDYTAQERAALVAWHLAHGEGMDCQAVMAVTGLHRRAANELMDQLSRVLPIYRDRGIWYVCSMQEAV